jgi:hypothetical protein
VHSGNLRVTTNIIVDGVTRLENHIYLGNSGKAYLYGTDVVGNIGVNTMTPIASFDISSSYPLAFNVGSAVQEQLYSVPVQNKNNRGILLAANTTTSKIAFFNDFSVNTNTNLANGSITYSNGGFMTIDVSDNTNILSKLSVSNRANNVVSHLMGETAVIYDTYTGTYLKPVYENSTETTGSALSLIANDSSSNTFMNIITPNKQGLSIGGGVYPNDQTRAMGTIGWRDTSENYTPSVNLISGKSKTRNKTTVGINTHAPTTDNYAFDVNGPVHLKSGELTITSQPSMEILSISVGKIANKHAVAVGSSYVTEYDSIANKDYYRHKILYTSDGGENWKENYDLSGDSIETQTDPIKINSAYVYDASLTIIGGDYTFGYYTYNGYGESNVWKTITNPYNSGSALFARNYSIKSIYINSSKRVFYGIDFFGGLNSILYSFNIPANIPTNGIATSLYQDSSLDLPYSGGIRSMEGYGNILWSIIGTNVFKINTSDDSVILIKTGNYNSISILDQKN